MVGSVLFTVILLLATLLLLGTGAPFQDLRDDLRYFENIDDLQLRAHTISHRRLTFESLHFDDGLRAAGYPEVCLASSSACLLRMLKMQKFRPCYFRTWNCHSMHSASKG